MEKKRNIVETVKDFKYSLPSMFIGIYILLQGIFIVIVIGSDSRFESVTYIKVSEIIMFIVFLIITFFTWKSASNHSKENEKNLWGIIVKVILVVMLVLIIDYEISGDGTRIRTSNIERQKTINQILRQSMYEDTKVRAKMQRLKDEFGN